MTKLVDISNGFRTLDDYEAFGSLVPAVMELKAEAAELAPHLAGRTIWMINSTPHGGGVAEMLPSMVSLLRDLCFSTEWAVIESDEEDFFVLTKRIHNLIHGEGDPNLTAEHRRLYEAVNAENAAALAPRMKPGDVLIVHDPQPMALAAEIRRQVDVRAVWRCHIGLDAENAATDAAWTFLQPYADAYDHAVFSAPEYVPPFLAHRASVIFPAIDPLTDKNRGLHVHKLVGVLANAGLARSAEPVLTAPFAHRAQRLRPDGSWSLADSLGEIGLLSRPIITQISRWDRLKGFLPLLQAFVRLKRGVADGFGADAGREGIHQRRRELVRLVLAGPDPESIQDDPEALETLEEIRSAYMALEPSIQEDVAVLSLPMHSRRENSLMVNALQRASSIVVQNSLREGFGLTITEAMWKAIPVLTNSQACGPRHQVRDHLDGCLVHDPRDSEALASLMDAMLANREGRDAWGLSAQRRVYERFLVLSQLRSWIEVLWEIL